MPKTETDLNPERLIDWRRVAKLNKITKREIYAAVALHALLSIPPSQRPKGAAKAAVAAADALINELAKR